MKTGGSYDIYASWFKNRIASWPKRIFSIGSNHAIFKKIASAAEQAGTGALPVHDILRQAQDYFREIRNFTAGQYKLAAEALISALDDPRYTSVLTSELAPLLFPSCKDIPAVEIAGALHEIANQYGKKHG
jgi:hypothetical protein